MSYESDELDLFMENDSALHPMKESILRTLRNRVSNGTYNPSKAIQAWRNWVEVGVRRYSVDVLGNPPKHYHQALAMFPTSVRNEVATEMARHYERALPGDGGIGWTGRNKKPRKRSKRGAYYKRIARKG